MNDLVKRLEEKQSIRITRLPKGEKPLEQQLAIGYWHVMFENTGTELTIKMNRSKCILPISSTGHAHVEGYITLNYVKINVIAEFDVESLKGEGYVSVVNDEEYAQLLRQ